jgi:hypothetical protein
MQQYNFLGHESLQIVWWGATNVVCSWTFAELYICQDYRALYTWENIWLQMLVLCLWGDTFKIFYEPIKIKYFFCYVKKL